MSKEEKILYCENTNVMKSSQRLIIEGVEFFREDVLLEAFTKVGEQEVSSFKSSLIERLEEEVKKLGEQIEDIIKYGSSYERDLPYLEGRLFEAEKAIELINNHGIHR